MSDETQKTHRVTATLTTEYALKWDELCGSLTSSQKLISIIDRLEREARPINTKLNMDEKTIFDN